MKDTVNVYKTVCKPFRETGYCGYGDGCKYLHERCVDVQEVMSAEIPSLCGICEREFTEEVVTECGHKFCASCAIKKYQEVDECGMCKKPTYGKFWIK